MAAAELAALAAPVHATQLLRKDPGPLVQHANDGHAIEGGEIGAMLEVEAGDDEVTIVMQPQVSDGSNAKSKWTSLMTAISD